MRDPKRIKKFCDELARIWESQAPDWRFGQLIVNVCGGSDPFFVEDEKMLEWFQAYFQCFPEETEV